MTASDMAFPCPMGPDYPECDRGMTLRDYFAAKAMQALIAKLPFGDSDGVLAPPPPKGESRESIMANVCASAFDYADGMLAARKYQ